MTKGWTNKEITELIQVLETVGIATRNDFSFLDSRISRELQRVLADMGYSNFIYFEEALDTFIDYPGAIYNTDYYDDKEAREYMRKYVLKNFASIE